MKNIFLVFVGSGLGGCLRYAINLLFISNSFPYATLVVNVFASFLLGVFFECAAVYIHIQQEIKLLLMVGFCGGLSTFSTFSADMYNLYSKNPFISLLYIVLSIFLCLTLFVFGTKVINYIRL